MRESTVARLLGWLARYGPAELLGTAAALAAAVAAHALAGNVALAAVAANWAEALGYYGVIAWRDLRAAGVSRAGALATIRALLIEFGPAELLSLLVVRNAALFGGMSLAPSLELGVLAGKLAADVLFYLPAIVSYELLRGRPRAQEGAGA